MSEAITSERNPSASATIFQMNRILVVGGGVAGLTLTRALRFAPVAITLIDPNPIHVFPRDLYRASTPGFDPIKLGLSWTAALGAQRNAQYIPARAIYLDSTRRRLTLEDRTLPYDTLVIATGARARFERPHWGDLAPGLRSSADALRVHQLLRESSASIVIAGGGAAGVELAATAARAWPDRPVTILEERDHLLHDFPDRLRAEAAARLRALGITIRTGATVIGVTPAGARVSTDSARITIPGIVLLAAGISGSAFAETLAQETMAPLDDTGRVIVNPDLTIPGHPEIFVIGDTAHVAHHGSPLPALGTAASQQARYVASAIRDRLAGYQAPPFEYIDQGRFALIGIGGVGVIGDTELTGKPAWIAARLALRFGSSHLPFSRFRAHTAVAASKT